MNFFEHQAQARRRSRRLLVAFAFAVLVVVVALDLIVLVTVACMSDEPGFFSTPQRWSPVAGWSSALLLATIGIACLYRMATLVNASWSVPLDAGATQIAPDSANPRDRRLLNVVEEIAIASGTPVPLVFVLERDIGINAFAAGYSTSDATITVTRGALDKLTRDELQGVIAHEFSHILNGDMRINVRLMGLLFGIEFPAIAARKLFERDSGGDVGHIGVYLAAIAVMVVGYSGEFLGQIIRARVSRTREFLADASAVQFTRQASGLAGALKKAAGMKVGTRLHGAQAGQIAHMLFGDGVGATGLLATHPPLETRIRRLEPGFRMSLLGARVTQWNAPDFLPDDLVDAQGRVPVGAPERGLNPAAFVGLVGQPHAREVALAKRMHAHLPPAWMQAVHDQAVAADAVFALLIQHYLLHAAALLALIETDWGARRAGRVRGMAMQLPGLARAQRLPLAALAMPALRRRPPEDLRHFLGTLGKMILADGQIELFEFALGRLLRVQLADVLAPAAAERPGRLELDQCEHEIALLMAVICGEGHSDEATARRAFLLGMQHLRPQSAARYARVPHWQQPMDDALNRLDHLKGVGKALLIEALAVTVAADGQLSVAEAELLRAICASLHAPLPPLMESTPT